MVRRLYSFTSVGYDSLILLSFVNTCCHRNMQLGVSAIVCYLHACRHQNEAKCRKYLARTIWLMTYDDEKVCYELSCMDWTL